MTDKDKGKQGKIRLKERTITGKVKYLITYLAIHEGRIGQLERRLKALEDIPETSQSEAKVNAAPVGSLDSTLGNDATKRNPTLVEYPVLNIHLAPTETVVLADVEDDDPRLCGDKPGPSWICTRPKGHNGKHYAGSDDGKQVYAEWSTQLQDATPTRATAPQQQKEKRPEPQQQTQDEIKVGDTVECIEKSWLGGDEWGIVGKRYIVERINAEAPGSNPHIEITGNTCAVMASRFKKVQPSEGYSGKPRDDDGGTYLDKTQRYHPADEKPTKAKPVIHADEVERDFNGPQQPSKETLWICENAGKCKVDCYFQTPMAPPSNTWTETFKNFRCDVKTGIVGSKCIPYKQQPTTVCEYRINDHHPGRKGFLCAKDEGHTLCWETPCIDSFDCCACLCAAGKCPKPKDAAKGKQKHEHWWEYCAECKAEKNLCSCADATLVGGCPIYDEHAHKRLPAEVYEGTPPKKAKGVTVRAEDVYHKPKIVQGASPQQTYYEKKLSCAGCIRECVKDGWLNQGCMCCKRNGLEVSEKTPDKYNKGKPKSPPLPNATHVDDSHPRPKSRRTTVIQPERKKKVK